MVDFNNPLRITLVLAFVAVFAPLMAMLPGLPFLLFPLRGGEELCYPDGITFAEASQVFSIVRWDCGDWDRPGPCPLTVHYAGVDYDAPRLASPDQLRRDGWAEQIFENPKGTETGRRMWSPGRVIDCSYRNGRLTNVTVYANEASGAVVLSLNRGHLTLPNTREAIIEMFGPPLPAKSP